MAERDGVRLQAREVIPLSVAWDSIGGLVDAHERFLAGAPVDSDVRDPVLDSWKRCRSAGLEPHRLLIPYAPDLAMEDPFLHAADPVLTQLTASLAHVSMTVVLCDGQARMVQRHGGDRQLLARLDDVNFAPGFCASEAAAGTNGVGTALVERRPVYILGREHFADCLSPFACAGAPVRNPLSGRIEAILDLTCLRDDGDPAMLRLVREAAHDIEARLLEQATERERALLAAYRRAARDAPGPALWPRQPEVPPGEHGPHGHDGERLGRVDLAVLREKAEELIASPHLTLDEVALSGGRVATLLRRPVMGTAGELGVVVEARVLGGPQLRHTELRSAPTPPVGQAPVPVSALIGQMPSAPIEQAPSAPIEQAPSAPIEQAPSAPIEQAPSAPIGQMPSPPPGRTTPSAAGPASPRTTTASAVAVESPPAPAAPPPSYCTRSHRPPHRPSPSRRGPRRPGPPRTEPSAAPSATPTPTPPTAGCCSSVKPGSGGWPCWLGGGWSCCTTPGSGWGRPWTSRGPPRNSRR